MLPTLPVIKQKEMVNQIEEYGGGWDETVESLGKHKRKLYKWQKRGSEEKYFGAKKSVYVAKIKAQYEKFSQH